MQGFNSSLPTVMHVDLNSCFASVEQQANPLLRGKPIAVAAYTTGNGCILAASREAKKLGIKTGMAVREGRYIYPRLVVLPPDPEKYRFINRKLQALLSSYTAHLSVESIDEMVMDLQKTPALHSFLSFRAKSRNLSKDRWLERDLSTRPAKPDLVEMTKQSMIAISQEIKHRIKQEIGDWLTVSIGIAPNRYLAKVASGLHKPDGLDILVKENIEAVFQPMALEDLCGIKEGIGRRLRIAGIKTPVELFYASAAALIQALHSKTGYAWWQRLHGYEDGVMYKDFDKNRDIQKTFGQSFALGTPRIPQDPELWKVLSQLVVKMGRRLRADNFEAKGIHVSCLFRDYTHWDKGYRSSIPLFADSDFFHFSHHLLVQAPSKQVRIIAITCYDLVPKGTGQMALWQTDEKKKRITKALDAIANRWGEFTVMPGRMLAMEQKVLDRIAFGRVREQTRI